MTYIVSGGALNSTHSLDVTIHTRLHAFVCLVCVGLHQLACEYCVHVTMCSAVLGMLTVGNMMSMVTKGKVDVTDTVSKVIYRQFRQVWSFL